MKIAIGSDHRGFDAKRRLVATLKTRDTCPSDRGDTDADERMHEKMCAAVFMGPAAPHVPLVA